MLICSLIPNPEAVLSLEPEELAGVLLQHFNSLPAGEQERLNRYNFSLANTVQGYPGEYQDRVSRALMEAWVWLEREGLLAPKPGSQGEWFFITRRGRQLTTQDDLRHYRRGNLLPPQLLNPRIAQKAWASFLRGDYDTAVFQAFKEVEVSVREAGSFPGTEVGVNLMREAFKPKIGPLADHSLPIPEQEALASLFAGAMGLYKNPHSHRNVTIEAGESVEMIMASHLLGIVDRRRNPAAKQADTRPVRFK